MKKSNKFSSFFLSIIIGSAVVNTVRWVLYGSFTAELATAPDRALAVAFACFIAGGFYLIRES